MTIEINQGLFFFNLIYSAFFLLIIYEVNGIPVGKILKTAIS